MIYHAIRGMQKKKQRWLAVILATSMFLSVMRPVVVMAENDSISGESIISEDMMAGLVTDTSSGVELTALPVSFTEGEPYCINNNYCGKYLAYESSRIVPRSGVSGIIVNKIKWYFEPVGSLYAIRLASQSNLYLGAVNSLSSIDVEAVTVSDGNIPNRCLWNITIASGGGCMIQNTYNSKYLCSYGSSVYTTMLGSVGTSGYTTCVWRIIIRENISDLAAGTPFFNNYLVAGYTYTPRYRTSATWSTPSDFTYTGYNSSVISIASDGTITAKSAGTTTVTVQHKVTGFSFSFNITVYTPGTCLGTLTTWCNTEEDRIGKWSASPVIYYKKLNSNSTFYFSSGYSTALSQWRTALGLSLSTTSSESAADIVSYGGTPEVLSDFGFDEELGVGGLTCVSSSYIGYYTMTGTAKACFQINDVIVYIVDRSGRTLNGYRNVITHELGHALGFTGHTSGESTVMYPYASEIYTLTTADKSELQQIYD